MTITLFKFKQNILFKSISTKLKDFFTRKVPIILQYELVECGAASLSMILRYYGLYLPLSELRVACGVSRDGSNLLSIKKAAISYGLDAVAKRCSIEQFMNGEISFPCITWWNYNHFLVVERVVNNKVYICDPGAGRYRVGRQDFSNSYSGFNLSLSPNEGFVASGKPERELFGFFPYLLKYKIPLLFTLSLTTALIVPSIVSPGLSGSFVNDFISNRRYELGLPILWLSLFVAIISAALTLTKLNIIRRISLQLQRRLSLHIARKIFTVQYTFFSSRFNGDVAARLNLASNITTTLIYKMLPFLLGLVGALLILPFILLISWQLSLVSLLYVTLNCILAVFISSSILDDNRSLQVETGKIGGLTSRMLSDTKTIKSSGLERSYLINWQQFFVPILTKSQVIQSKNNTYQLYSSLISSIYRYGTIAYSGYLVMTGSLNLAGFMAFQVLRSQVTEPLISLGTLSTQLQQAEAELGRLSDLYSVSDDEKVRSLNSISQLENKKYRSNFETNNKESSDNQLDKIYSYNISIEDVSLKFSPLKSPVLNNLNINIPQGSITSIVGPSGSGKSTLIKIISGLYDPTSGFVLYGGKRWLDYSDLTIRNAIGYVSQEISAIRGTIAENITFFDPNFSLDQIREASKLAEFDHVAMSNPKGYSTQLGDQGLGLSGGQLQRLEIARSLMKKPKILLLDEATSALDIPTEKKILANLKAEGITLICVAHRLISAKMSDQVIVLEDGMISEIGSPSELSKNTEGTFAKMLSTENNLNDKTLTT